MNDIKDKSGSSFFGGWLYFLFSIVAGIPVYLAVHAYVKVIQVQEDDATAFGSAVVFMLGIFAGRYITQVWSSTLKKYPWQLLFGLSLLIITCLGWLFFHADFPLHGRVAINLMLFWLPFVMISIALGSLIKIIHAVTSNQLTDAKLHAAHSKSELHLLQSQLSPHFLFNTLNNLYGLSITEHQKIPGLLLKLSELLRYSVHDAGELFVPLKNELAYIRNYIEFEKIRIGDRLMLTTELEEMLEPYIRIAPMLLIVFIENAFKHSKNTASPEIFVDIKLKTWGSFILFSVKNSYGIEEQKDNILRKSSGVGLVNARKRLELLYPGTHELNVQQDELFYQVELRLKIK
ncbi:MAG: hypothetical protein JWR38_1487 [Mucilaginibacter sp.]|nr:hypothetical protein [Mucilaginibacter sp.]